MTNDIDSFASMFDEAPSARKEARQRRKTRERRTQLTDKQRNRVAVRTEQLNFRCTKSFKARVEAGKERLRVSVADAMEEAWDLLEKEIDRREKSGDGFDAGDH